MKLLALFLLVFSSLNAITLTEIIKHSLTNSPSLEVINTRIDVNKKNIIIAQSFNNPEVSLKSNTLKNTEKMNQTIIGFKQKIEYYNKRESKKNIAQAEEALLKKELYFAKVTLVANIKREAYTIWEQEELLRVISIYIELTQQNIKLYESYASLQSSQHIGIMKAELSLAELKIQKSILTANIEAAYARLSYLAAFRVKNLELELKLTSKPTLKTLTKKLTNNPLLLIREKEIQKQDKNIKLTELNYYPDLNLVAEYAHRSHYDDYLNVGLSISLPIYGIETAKEEKAKAIKLSLLSQKEDTLMNIQTTLTAYYSQMISSYNIYHIIEDDALPTIKHMFELSNTSIAIGGDLFKYIDVLFSKLSLEKKSIKAMGTYYKMEAKISELTGALQ